MLELLALSHQWPRRSSTKPGSAALDGIHFTLPDGHLMAVLGATGSGKSTLLKLLTAQEKVQAGAILWRGREVAAQGLHPSLIGWVPADTQGVHSTLNVKEHVVSAILLRVGGIEHRAALLRADRLLVLCGLDSVGGKRGGELDLAQKRRLALAMALVTEPHLVVCDEFTHGCEPKAERELAALLQQVVKESPGRMVVNATSSLAELNTYDSVLVLHEGRVCFHGPGRALTHYFSIPHTEDLYHRLAKRPSERWQNSWDRHSESYYDAFKLTGSTSDSAASLGSADDDDDRVSLSRPRKIEESENPAASEAPGEGQATPSFPKQLQVLLRRQWTMFRRQTDAWWWQLGFVLAVPLLLVLLGLSTFNQVKLAGAGSATGAVGFSMLTLFQIGLLLAAAAWTTSPLLADTRAAWGSERVGGLGLGVWLTAHLVFSLLLLLAQSFLVIFATELIVGPLPAGGAWRAVLLILTSLSFGTLCLGTSACSTNGDRASARCWALAFVNLLFSGALLAWPKGLGVVTQPLVTAALAWSGSMGTLEGSAVQASLEFVNATGFLSPLTALIGLLVHLALGVVLMALGAQRHR